MSMLLSVLLLLLSAAVAKASTARPADCCYSDVACLDDGAEHVTGWDDKCSVEGGHAHWSAVPLLLDGCCCLVVMVLPSCCRLDVSTSDVTDVHNVTSPLVPALQPCTHCCLSSALDQTALPPPTPGPTPTTTAPPSQPLRRPTWRSSRLKSW
jgi:hypothetical protein